MRLIQAIVTYQGDVTDRLAEATPGKVRLRDGNTDQRIDVTVSGPMPEDYYDVLELLVRKQAANFGEVLQVMWCIVEGAE